MKKLLIVAVLLLSKAYASISGVSVAASTQTTATITWTTTTAGGSQVLYGLNGAINLASPVDSRLLTSHSITLAGLVANQVYTYKVVSGADTSSSNTFSLCSVGSNAGYTKVTGSINVAYGQGAVSAVWVNDSGVVTSTPTVCGSTFPTTINSVLTPDGNLSIPLPDNNMVVPSPGRWTLNVSNSTGLTGTFAVTTAITGQNLGLTAQLQAAAAGKLQIVYYDAATASFDPAISPGGGITAVTGTPGQIDVAAGTTAPVVSIPSTFTFPGTVTNNLSIFGATSSAQFLGLITDESGSGAVMGNVSPTIVTPMIASFVNAAHSHTNAAGGGTLSLTGGAFPNQGTTITVFHGNASGNGAFGQVVNADIATGTIDVTTKIAGIVPSANGGTNNAFVNVTGPSGTVKNYALPNASTTILTTNAAVTVPQGGTNLASGTSGGMLCFTGTTTLASSGALTANLPVIGGGAGVCPTVGTVSGNTTAFVTTTGVKTPGDVLTWDSSGNAIDGGAPGGTVTSVGMSVSTGLLSVSGSPVTGAGSFSLTIAGTSGGVPYFISGSALASSGALTANAPVLGGGAGGAPTVGSRSGNTTVFGTVNGAVVNTHLAKFDASGNIIDGGAPTSTVGGANTQIQYNCSGAFCGDGTLTFSTAKGLISVPYMASATGPYIDPKAAPYNCANNGTTDDTVCFQAAVTYASTNKGMVLCSGDYKLDRVTVPSNTWIEGTNNNNAHGCRIFVKTDAAFVSPAPVTNFLGSITFRKIQFIGGTNVIDLPYINSSDYEDLSFFNHTGCAISLVFGEQRILRNINSTHTGNNGFATLCTGDPSKSLFSASLTPGFGGMDRSIVEQLVEQGSLNGGSGNYDQWLWWHFSGGIDDSRISNLVCFFSCITGVWQVGDNTGQSVLFNSLVSTIDLDHVGLGSGSPAGTLVNIQGSLDQSLITNYDPDHNTNYFTTQMFVDACNDATLMNMKFSGSAHGVDNSTKFGLKFGNHGGNRCNLIGIGGGLYTASGNNFKNMMSILSGNFEPSNFNSGAQIVDQQNDGMQVVLANNFTGNNAAAATSLFQVTRGVGDGSTWTQDLTSNGSLLSVNEYLGTTAVTVGALPTAAAGNKGQMRQVSDSTAVIAEGQTCVGGSSNTALAFSNGAVWKCF